MTTRALLACMVLGGVLAACAYRPPEYPLTQTQFAFSDRDATKVGLAPAVADRVDGARIAAARSEPQNWLTYYGAYDAQRYSALDQVNAGNVRNLRPAWIFQAGVIGPIANAATYALEAAPIVVDGVMYFSGWDGYVWALDAASGQTLWRFRQAIPFDVALCCGNVNRGVAVAQGKVYYASPDGHLIALDARTGRLAWEVPFADVRAGESATMAPLVVRNLVFVGSSGAEYGVRGHIDAFDLSSGRPAWRRYTVPKPGEAGSQSWGDTEAWQRGGGSAWVTGSYDPALDTLYWSTGNPGPDFDGSVRPGDNLYTDSVLALNPADGSIKWHYQFTPHDVWDYDGVNENILFDSNGQRLLAHFDKNGHLFVLDRVSGRLVRATPFTRTTWGEIDPTSGRTTPRLTPTAGGAEICPGPAGGKEWPHAAYSPQTGLLYTPVVDACGTFKLLPGKFKESMPYWGGDAGVSPEQAHGGQVKAFDPATGRMVWEYRGPHPIVASLLTTAGGLVFVGEPTGEFKALDARSGQVLWNFRTGSGIHSNPISYSVGGKQYIAVATGWGGWLKGFAPETYGGNRGSALVVFALP